jgi:uncharacterized OB-fold protein
VGRASGDVNPVISADETAGIPRVLPVLDELNRFFWKAGEDGELRFLRCQQCRLFLHPPSPVCRRCYSTDVAPEAVSGLGTVISFTINHQAWTPEVTAPYAIVIVRLDEQTDLHLTSNIVGCPYDAVFIGQRVEVAFLPRGEYWVPLFRPIPGA